LYYASVAGIFRAFSAVSGEYVMNGRVLGYLLLGLAGLLYVAVAASVFAVLYALTVRTTLAAVESAFGTLVATILLLVLARKCWEAGKKRIGINT
jgi:hypothetical protein